MPVATGIIASSWRMAEEKNRLLLFSGYLAHSRIMTLRKPSPANTTPKVAIVCTMPQRPYPSGARALAIRIVASMPSACPTKLDTESNDQFLAKRLLRSEFNFVKQHFRMTQTNGCHIRAST